MDEIEKYTKYLGQSVHVEIDRPLGSKHPRFDFIYQTNYGFIPGTRAGDGHEIDAYVLGESKPLAAYDGQCIAVILRKDDVEHKLVVSNQCHDKQTIQKMVGFVEDYYDTELITSKRKDASGAT